MRRWGDHGNRLSRADHREIQRRATAGETFAESFAGSAHAAHVDRRPVPPELKALPGNAYGLDSLAGGIAEALTGKSRPKREQVHMTRRALTVAARRA